MVAIKKNLRVFGWIIGAFILVLIVGYIYSTFFKQTSRFGHHGPAADWAVAGCGHHVSCLAAYRTAKRKSG
jgi:hypothetical protein